MSRPCFFVGCNSSDDSLPGLQVQRHAFESAGELHHLSGLHRSSSGELGKAGPTQSFHTYCLPKWAE